MVEKPCTKYLIHLTYDNCFSWTVYRYMRDNLSAFKVSILVDRAIKCFNDSLITLIPTFKDDAKVENQLVIYSIL